MLQAAKRAGEALLRAKKMLPHGSFKTWVEANCECSYRQAVRYMQVAKNDYVDTFDSDASLESILDTKRKTAPQPTFDETDARDPASWEGHAKKLHALATRGATDGERTAAQRKLR